MANQLYKGDKPLATFVPQIADNLTTDDSTKALSAKQGKVLNEKIEKITEVSTPTMQSVTGVTNQSEVVFIGNILYVNIDVTYSAGASEWSNAFVITNINKTLRSSFFGVVINGTGTSPRCVQAYQSGTDITVRLRYPQTDQYRGQLVLVFNQ